MCAVGRFEYAVISLRAFFPVAHTCILFRNISDSTPVNPVFCQPVLPSFVILDFFTGVLEILAECGGV